MFLRQRTKRSHSASPADCWRTVIRRALRCSPATNSNDPPQHNVYAAVHLCVKDSAKVHSRIFIVYFIETSFTELDDEYFSFIDESCVALTSLKWLRWSKQCVPAAASSKRTAPPLACCCSCCCVFCCKSDGVKALPVTQELASVFCAGVRRRSSHRSRRYPAKIASTTGAERLLVSRMELERIHSRLKVAVKAHQVGRS